MNNIITLKGSQISKEKALDKDISYVLRTEISENLCLIMENRRQNVQSFDNNKTYYLILEDMDNMTDGIVNYIDFIGSYGKGKLQTGIYQNYTKPFTSDKNIINGYEGIIVGACVRMNGILGYETHSQCSGFFRGEFLGARSNNILGLEIAPGVHIPINPGFEKLWKISENDNQYNVFSCRFGYQGVSGENIEYTHLNNYLYVSGVILDVDPATLELPSGKTYFDDID